MQAACRKQECGVGHIVRIETAPSSPSDRARATGRLLRQQRRVAPMTSSMGPSFQRRTTRGGRPAAPHDHMQPPYRRPTERSLPHHRAAMATQGSERINLERGEGRSKRACCNLVVDRIFDLSLHRVFEEGGKSWTGPSKHVAPHRLIQHSRR